MLERGLGGYAQANQPSYGESCRSWRRLFSVFSFCQYQNGGAEALWFERPRETVSSEIQVQSELDDTVTVERCATDCSKSSRVLRSCRTEVAQRGVSHRLRELGVIRQVEGRSFKGQLGLLSGRNLEILLDREVKIVSAWVA